MRQLQAVGTDTSLCVFTYTYDANLALSANDGAGTGCTSYEMKDLTTGIVADSKKWTVNFYNRIAYADNATAQAAYTTMQQDMAHTFTATGFNDGSNDFWNDNVVYMTSTTPWDDSKVDPENPDGGDDDKKDDSGAASLTIAAAGLAISAFAF